MNSAFDYGLLNTQADPRFGDRKYGRFGTVAKNGCGMIALYNVERAARPETRFEPFYANRKSIKTNLFGLLGTRPSSIRKNLEAKGFSVTKIDLKHPDPTAHYDAVIILYWYWFGAHYVTGLSKENGTYMYYNFFSAPYAMRIDRFLAEVRKRRNHVVRIWGVDFPKTAA